MKKTLLILLSLSSLLTALPVYAKTQYISDELKVPLRQTPCARCKIVHHGLPSGTPLTVLEVNSEGWAHIKTSRGMEGWLPNRYLVSQQIARFRLEQAEKKLAATVEENRNLKEQLLSLSQSSESLAEKLNSEQLTTDELNAELESVRKLSANAFNIQSQNEELLKKNNMLQGELDILLANNKALRSDRSQNWFFYGALSVFMGAILAILLPRLKRRKQYSEWR